jgi:hypothetical protein
MGYYMQGLAALIVACILMLVLALQVQVRMLSTKIDKLLAKLDRK